MDTERHRSRVGSTQPAVSAERGGAIRRRQRSIAEIRESLRELRIQLSLLNYRVGLNKLLSDYSDSELEAIADFMRRTVDAGRDATDELAGE